MSGDEPGRVASCRHCGDPIDAYHRRIWPDYPFHVTCATKPMVDGVCPFEGNEGMCFKHKTAPARVLSSDESGDGADFRA